MAGLPKKYAKMGFKKGWREYKKVHSKSRKPYKKSSNLKPKTRRGGNKGMFNFGGGLGKGIVVGVAAGVINRFLPINIAGADLVIAGMIMKDSTVQKIGAITLGRSISGSITGLAQGAIGGNSGGGF